MFRSDGYLVVWRSHHLPLVPALLVANKSSLNEDVVQENVHDIVMAGVDLAAHLPAAAEEVLCIESFLSRFTNTSTQPFPL